MDALLEFNLDFPLSINFIINIIGNPTRNLNYTWDCILVDFFGDKVNIVYA